MGWIDLFTNKILPDVVGERAAPFVFALLVLGLGLCAAMPLLVLWIARQVNRLRTAVAATEAHLERLTQRGLETHSMVKESFALVQDRLAGVPPPTRFGPEGEKDKGAEASTAGAAAVSTAEGQGSYNYCPACKEIRFLKFFRCQTCGFHVPR